jgi:hypothetical protein|nr:MAG TPA: helix-turn-helix domain protein [Caudoviricetes sp.]
MAVPESSYVSIQAFMVNDLHLGGNELILFACIHGFSQDGSSWFTGSRAYLAEWCQSSKKTVSNNLAKLCDRGYLEKRTRVENGVTFNDYRVAKKLTGVEKKVPRGVEKSSTPPVEKSSPHNLEEDITRRNTRERKRFAPPTLAEVSDYCKERGNSIDPQRFIDYYESNGWKVGRNPMKDWKAAVRNWERGDGRRAEKQAYKPSDETEWDF